MAQIAIETYEGTPIVFDMISARFEAVIEGDTIFHDTLRALHGQLTRIKMQQQVAARKAQKPVTVLALLEVHQGKPTLQPCVILGIHAGRIHRKALRALVDDTKATLATGYHNPHHLVAMHPCDPRAATVRAHIQAIAAAEAQLADATTAFKDFKATLPSVYIPTVDTKESALEAEPAFLAELQEAITSGLALPSTTPQVASV